MAEQHDKVLAALGVSADNIKKLNALTPEQLKDFKTDEFTTPVVTSFQTKFLNDNEFLNKLSVDKLPESVLKAIESNQYGRFMTELREFATDELGLDIKKFSDEEQKGLKKFFRRANTDYVALKAGDPKTLTDLQTQLSMALKQKEETEKSVDKKVQDAVTSEKTKIGSSLEKLLTKNYLLSLKNDGWDLKTNPDYIVDAVSSKMKTNYTLNVNDDNSFSIKQKANPQLDVLSTNGEVKTYKDALVELLEADKMITKVEGTEKEKTPVTVQVEGGKTEIPSYIAQKVNNNIAAEKAAAGTT